VQVQRTVVASVWKPTERKRSRLEEISNLWRKALTLKTYKERRNLDRSYHSAYARNVFKARSEKGPVYLAHYDFKLKDTGNKLARWFARIPYKRGEPLWIPLRMRAEDEDLLSSVEIKDSQLVKKKDRYWLHITIAKEVEPRHAHGGVIGVDLGERFLAVTAFRERPGRLDSALAPPRFYGKDARAVRRHHSWLRKRLGERKLLRTIKKVGDRERRRINTICHQIARSIVNEAKEKGAAIAIGILQGIRRRAKGRRMNRMVSNMPYYRLTRYIEYKASWEGISVIQLQEAFTSQTCHFCHSEGRRPYRGLFKCPSCGHQYNADYNGAVNIAERALEYISEVGAVGSPPIREAPLLRPLKVTSP